MDDRVGAAAAKSADGTVEVACLTLETLAGFADVLASALAPGDVVLLFGDLGSGKTTLTQALAHSLGIGEEQYVSSPTFALVHEYSGPIPLHHMDLYRLRDEEDVEATGILEYFDQRGVVLVEWPDRLGGLTPKDRLEIYLHPLAETTRRVRLVPHGQIWQKKLFQIEQQLVTCSN